MAKDTVIMEVIVDLLDSNGMESGEQITVEVPAGATLIPVAKFVDGSFLMQETTETHPH